MEQPIEPRCCNQYQPVLGDRTELDVWGLERIKGRGQVPCKTSHMHLTFLRKGRSILEAKGQIQVTDFSSEDKGS